MDAAYTIIDPTTSDRIQLSQCSEETDLGIWYTLDLKPSTHYCKAVTKAMQALNSLRDLSNEILPVRFFTNFTLDQPLSIVHQPGLPLYRLKDIDLLEQVHCQAT